MLAFDRDVNADTCFSTLYEGPHLIVSTHVPWHY